MLKQAVIRKSVGRILALLLLLVLVLGMTTIYVQPSQAKAAEIIASGNCGYNDRVKWKLDTEGVLVISGSGYMDDWDGHGNEYYRKSVKNVVI